MWLLLSNYVKLLRLIARTLDPKGNGARLATKVGVWRWAWPFAPFTSIHHGDRTTDSHAGRSMHSVDTVSGLSIEQRSSEYHFQTHPWHDQGPSSRS